MHHLRFVETSPLVEDLDWIVFLMGVNDVTRTLLETNDVLAPPAPSEVSPPYWRSSRILRTTRSAWNWHAETRSDWVEDEAGSNYVNRRALRQAGQRTSIVPDMGAALDTYETRIQAIIHACRERKVRPLFLTQPVLWQRGLNQEGSLSCGSGR